MTRCSKMKNKMDELLIEAAKKNGFEYTAKYIEMFGS